MACPAGEHVRERVVTAMTAFPHQAGTRAPLVGFLTGRERRRQPQSASLSEVESATGKNEMEFSHNAFVYVREPPRLPVPTWLPVARDPRPSCCLLLGDGFTQGFLAAAGLEDRIRCRIDDLVPAPANAVYIPVEGDRCDRGPFWDPEKWPRLYRTQEQSGLVGRDFFKSLALGAFNPSRERGRWSFRTGTLEYELRCYLWHLFRSYESGLTITGEQISRWSWSSLLHYLLAEFRVYVVSFNYDTWLEGLMSNGLACSDSYYRIPFTPFVERPRLDPFDYRAGTVLMVRPHGCIAHHLDFAGSAALGPNPWLTDHTFTENISSWNRTQFDRQPGFPMIPDLVPPGRQGDDYCNPDSIASPLGGEFIARSELVISCGLSGGEPDSAEVNALLQSLDTKTRFIQVGLAANEDSTNAVGAAAQRSVGERYMFYDASEVSRIRAQLLEWFPAHWKWAAVDEHDQAPIPTR